MRPIQDRAEVLQLDIYRAIADLAAAPRGVIGDLLLRQGTHRSRAAQRMRIRLALLLAALLVAGRPAAVEQHVDHAPHVIGRGCMLAVLPQIGAEHVV